MKTKTLMPLGYRGFLIAGAVAVAAFASLTLLVRADVAPTVTTTTYNSSNAAITSANIGSSVFATAHIGSSSTTTLPTGTVNFNRFENTSCTGTPTTQSGIALVNGIATSSSSAISASGLSYKVSYSGDSVNSAVEGICKSVTATAAATSIVGTLSTSSVLAGSTVYESSTLSGVTANASGTVAYVAYSDNSCTAALQGAGVKTVTNAIVPNSDTLLFNNAGTFYWKAVYAGDTNNAAATSSCVALTVLATSTPVTPTTTNMISGRVYNDLDKDMVNDAGEAGVAGFTIKLYKGAGWWANGSAFLTTTTDSNGNYNFPNLVNGTYSIELINMAPWHQDTPDYNSVVLASSSLTNMHFAVSSKNSTTTPPVGTTTPATISGKIYNDTDGDEKLDAGEAGIAGFTINLYKGANANGGKNNKAPFMTTTSDANGMYSFANLANGTYSVEEINKAGWHQDTGDYKNLKIKKGVALPNIDFANSVAATSTDNDNDNDDDDHDRDDFFKWVKNHGWGWWKNK
jgi:hypothetical protein